MSTVKLPRRSSHYLLSALLAGAPLAGQGAPSLPLHRKPPSEAKVARFGPDRVPSPSYAFLAAKILTLAGPPIADGVLLTENGKIVAVGKASEIAVPKQAQRIELGSAWLVPGFVDLHCHIGAADGRDINDMVHPTNPELRTLDVISLAQPRMLAARAGGVTTVLYIPGSGSNMGGFGTLLKTHGTPEEALVRFPGSLKIAQAGNPERFSGDLGMGVIGMNQGLRFTLERGRRYYQAWEDFDSGKGPEPAFDAELDYLRGLFRHEYPVTVHTQIYQVVLETLRQLRDEFGLWVVINHGEFDAYRLAEDALTRGVAICQGPRQYHFDRDQGRFIGLAAVWSQGGMHGWLEPVQGVGRDGIAVNTDSPVVAQEQLTLQAAMAVRLGLPWEWGLRAITINPARFVGIDDRVGSLEAGKDADFAAWSGDPLDPRSSVELTVVRGRIAYQRDPNHPVF